MRRRFSFLPQILHLTKSALGRILSFINMGNSAKEVTVLIQIGLRTDFDFVPDAAQLGFDYLELPLSRVAALSDGEFNELSVYVEALGLRVGAMYAMLPDSLRLTGPDVQARLQHDYLDRAFDRAWRLGAQVIAFDAAASRNVPAGVDFALARRQVGNFLRIVQGHAAPLGLQIAVQNLRHAECNLINTVSEAALMAALLQLGNVGVLADTVQMAYAGEPIDAIGRCGSSLIHVHTGCALTRSLPRADDGEDYARLFRILMKNGFSGGVSAVTSGECTPDSAAAALECLRIAREESLI